ncbi:GNAT family N-acetyltransferase, partial [bacterium M00.F.Ca.ET.179.01.1.1]
VTTGKVERPVLESEADGEAYLKASLRSHHYREFRRLKRRLADLGKVEHVVARGPDEIRHAIENFLTLESSGWKGRERTAMAIDRYRAALARDAVHRLAEHDMCRIHLLTLDGRDSACVAVFVE